MERLLVPTKSWAQRIGIRKTPDLREQRRLQDVHHFQARQSWSRQPTQNRDPGAASASEAPAPQAVPQQHVQPAINQTVSEDKQVLQPAVLQPLQPLPWPDKRTLL
eukprot:Skav210494  [mRNA]  locus=scaffold601:94272:105647:+ [translate_table: standard]